MLENVIGYEHKEWKSPIERFSNLSGWVLHILDTLHKKQKTNTYSLRATHMALKVKQYFRLLKTVVFLNIDYKKDLLVKQLYLVLSKNWQQVKVMLTNKKCMRHLLEHKALI